MRQNRVDPTGAIIRTDARGTVMGNRGVIHDVGQNIIRQFKHKAWITCALHFKNRHRIVMTPNRWTELFFLDEATAFAAGHRPCSECRKTNFKKFKSFWLAGNPEHGFNEKTSIKEIDAIIHEERIAKNYKTTTVEVLSREYPDGVFILRSNSPFLVAGTQVFEWSPAGYAPGVTASKDEVVKILTPHSIVNAFKAGYAPQFELPALAKKDASWK